MNVVKLERLKSEVETLAYLKKHDVNIAKVYGDVNCTRILQDINLRLNSEEQPFRRLTDEEYLTKTSHTGTVC